MRPQSLAEIIGQEHLIKVLKISIDAAKIEHRQLPHVLLEGSPGLGKTSIALAIANELGAEIKLLNGATTKSFKQLLPIFTSLEEGELIFIDEIHALPNKLQEFLYPVIEDNKLTLAGVEPINIDLPKFTLIGATTNSGVLNRPFYDRFPIKLGLNYYSDENLKTIILRTFAERGLDSDEKCGIILAKASRGTPRVAIGRAGFCADYAVSNGKSKVDESDAAASLQLVGIEPNGLCIDDKKYLKVLHHFKQPVGIKTICSMTGFEEEYILNSIEPFLLRLDLIVKTPQGRVLK